MSQGVECYSCLPKTAWPPTSEIIVGQNVPFITSQARDSTNLANTINTVERKDVGITLRLTPHIHESDFVSMEIYQESSAIVGDTLLNTSKSDRSHVVL